MTEEQERYSRKRNETIVQETEFMDSVEKEAGKPLYNRVSQDSHLNLGEPPERNKTPSATKDTNPKDAVGIKKAPMSTVSGPVLAELGVAMMEGARKYGRHNYRIAGVRASVYYDASMRHLMSWWEGEDLDPDSGLSHITKAIATLVVLRDSMIQENMKDDRPPKAPYGWLSKLNTAAATVVEKYPNALEAHCEKDQKG